MIAAYQLNVATGGLIVCVATAVFVLVLLLEPRRGVVGALRARRRNGRQVEPEPAVASHSH
jgi:hypothetical protein